MLNFNHETHAVSAQITHVVRSKRNSVWWVVFGGNSKQEYSTTACIRPSQWSLTHKNKRSRQK